MLTQNPLLDLVLKGIAWGIAAFVGAYLAQKGQHRASKEDFRLMLDKAQLEAEARKRGETDAFRKDLDLILDQLRQTTALTKQIEADITYAAWDRQMRVNLKRDQYTPAEAGHALLLEELRQEPLALLRIADGGKAISRIRAT